MATICSAVFHFPKDPAEIIFPSEAANDRRPLIIISRFNSTTTSKASMRPSGINKINTVETKNLSAMGSRSRPRFDSTLYLRAKYPSSQSESDARINSPAENQFHKGGAINIRATIKGTDRIRNRVSQSGSCFFQ